jgi:hypothetical protein
MVAPGQFVLHSHVVPDLPAGTYTVHVQQAISAPLATPETLDSHLEVTAPRFALPADQLLSTFPPNQGQGSFSTRLPQVVLKRRTLPWEREVQPGANLPREIPWLALVVLADAECQFQGGVPVAQCVTAGVTLPGPSDTAVGDCIVVTQDVVDQVFPTKSELPLLAHVRQVDMYDTELNMGDDDGWLAVLLSNRLPQPGVRYRACLISLEGQYDLLPDTAAVDEGFSSVYVYPEAVANLGSYLVASGGLLDGAVGTPAGALPASVLSAANRPGSPQAGSGPPGAPQSSAAQPGIDTAATRLPDATRAVARSVTVSDAWSAPGGAQVIATAQSSPVSTTFGAIGGMHSVNMGLIAPAAVQYTFPVLASWQFTCAGAGDFRSLMLGLDVGMLGTPPPTPPPPKPGQKPPPPPTRPGPEVLDTGHIALAHTSREGEPDTVWYRGPLVPRPMDREQPGPDGVLPLLHSSDQARRVGPDGRENLALAAAFEIGRLLALADPSVVAALLAWRKDGFDEARRNVLISLEPMLSLLGMTDIGSGFGARAGGTVVAALGANGAARLGPPRPLIDPGRPITAIDGVDTVALLATGLGMPAATVSQLLGPVTARTAVQVPIAAQTTSLDALAAAAHTELAGLRAASFGAAAAITSDVLATTAAGARDFGRTAGRGGPPAPGAPGPGGSTAPGSPAGPGTGPATEPGQEG